MERKNKTTDMPAILAVLSLFGIAAVTAIVIMPSVANAADIQITSFTPDDNLNIKITNVDATKFQAYFAHKSKTTMNPIAQALVEAGNAHNMNSIFIMALAAWEGSWGTSGYAATRHNWFGYGALYENPDKAWEFSSDIEGVDVVARRIKAEYLLSSGTYSVLVPSPAINGYFTYPYFTQTVNAGGIKFNGATVRGWIIKWNINNQDEMNGIISIMNDFASWHVQTYGEGIKIAQSADLNTDGYVNSADLGILMSYWGSTSNLPADLNQDGIVNSVDYGIMMSQWTNTNPTPTPTPINYDPQPVIIDPTPTPVSTYNPPPPTPTSTPTPVPPTSTPTPTVIPPTPIPTPTPSNSVTYTLNWHLEGNDGSAGTDYQIPQNILMDKESITLTYDLHGTCFGGGDESEIAFEQDGHKHISLSNYGVNCKDGEQTVTIPLSDFQGLDKNANVGEWFMTRFWSNGPFVVDIYSVSFNTMGSTPIPTATPTPVPTAPTPTPIPSDTEAITLNWHLAGNNGDSQAYQDVPANILSGKTSITLTYNLHGTCFGGGDESAIIFDQYGWKYISLNNYGQNCLDGEQTVIIPLSDFPNLDTNTPLTGMFHTRFWSGGVFMVDIISVKFNAESGNTVQLNWHLAGNNGDSQAYQDVPANILSGKTSITLTYNLHGTCFGGGDESAIIFDQYGWKYISLNNYGQNCLDGEQTATIPLSDFPDLDTSIDLTGKFHTRFWFGGVFTVDIPIVIWN